jgi:hypothetical protein
MQRPCGRRVRKLSDRVGDPKPSSRPGAVTIRREFVHAFGAFNIASSSQRVSVRLATRQMSISGIMLERLSGGPISMVKLPVPHAQPLNCPAYDT